MIPLIKIRGKYLLRNKCVLICNYLALPIIVFFIFLSNLSSRKNTKIKPKAEFPQTGEIYLFKESDGTSREYKNLKEYLPFIAFSVDTEEDGENLKDFIKEETGITIGYNFSVQELNRTQYPNAIILKHSIKKDSYLFTLDEKLFGSRNNPVIFNPRGLSTEEAIDLFDTSIFEDFDAEGVLDTKSRYNTFFELQSLLAKFLIKQKTKDFPNKDLKITNAFNSYPPYSDFNSSSNSGYIYYGLLITVQFSLMIYIFSGRMIDEKEQKLTILLERQGITGINYFFSWFLTYLTLTTICSIVFIIFILSELYFHGTLLIINMLLFNVELYFTAVFFSQCISTIKTGSTGLKFYHFGATIIGTVICNAKTPKITKVIFSFLPQVNFYLNLCSIYKLQNFKTLSWDLIWLNANKISYMETIVMYILGLIFYFVASLIIYSYKNSGLDFISYLKSYFTKVQRQVNYPENLLENDKESSFTQNHQELTEENLKHQGDNHSLKIVNVSRIFGDLKAVDGFNGELFPNEIFCLLGHNGAGKTTLIKMISGMEKPDKGDIFLDGKSLVTNRSYLYENIGLCQQEDIYFSHLTVAEHLKYMCEIKGAKADPAQINDLITRIELLEKANSYCDTLSGGQKRKLCIALALIGNSKIILLDEPTSGMDVIAKRSLWEFLKNYKDNKIIVLTTHSLDEAEYLGDRIGIVSDGHFLCSGTSSYLKEKYPCGFYLNLLINPTLFNESFKQNIFEKIKELEPKAEIKIASKGIFSINIESDNQNITQILQIVEELKQQNGIEDYTVSSTSLEDVFLKINNKAVLNDQQYENKKDENVLDIRDFQVASIDFFSQLLSHMKRELYPLLRNKILFLMEILGGLGLVYIFVFFFSDLILNMTTSKLNLLKVLEANKIYIYEELENYLEKSYIYEKMSNFISLKKVNKAQTIEEFKNEIYEKASGNIAKGGIAIKKENTQSNEIIIYNTEIPIYGDYLYANSMFFVSSFLKNEYNINACILSEISGSQVLASNEKDFDFNLEEFFVLIINSITCLVGFLTFLSGLMLEKIKERTSNIKHLLILSGTNIWSYWLGFFIVDYIKLMIFSILLIAPVYYISKGAFYFWLDLPVACFSSLLFIYFLSFFCSKEDSGPKVLYLIVLGFFIIVFSLYLALDINFGESSRFIDILFKPYNINFFDFTPLTSMTLCFSRLLISFVVFDSLDNSFMGKLFENEENFDLFYRPKIYLYSNYIAQGLNLVVYGILLIIAESGILGNFIHYIKIKFFIKENDYVFSVEQAPEDFVNNNNISSSLSPGQMFEYQQGPMSQVNGSKDKEVILQEIQQINPLDEPLIYQKRNKNSLRDVMNNPFILNEINKTKNNNKLTTKIENLRKTFWYCCKKNVRAINNLYLGLEANEKFGLLGFNGSGKTTTFKSITNEILVDSGKITLFGKDNKKNFGEIRRILGYCPQTNPLFGFMKVREIIKFYKELKVCNESVEEICNKFGLGKYLDSFCINLSGGNKRKLVFAIALMNKPRILLLDEPSTGVDPESRRIMWRNINELSSTGHQYNMILTTHSMEEAEILCDTVSWLKAGNFICLGNPEKLKITFSAGYQLHVKFVNLSNEEQISNDLLPDLLNSASTVVSRINEYAQAFYNIPVIVPYLKALLEILAQINDKTNGIIFNGIGRDLSFELILHIKKETQCQLFSDILNMKRNNQQISEISITMQSLENILTSL